MALDDALRDRTILVGGKVTGVECPDCEFDGRALDIDSHSTEEVRCPECGAIILTSDQKSELRRMEKL